MMLPTACMQLEMSATCDTIKCKAVDANEG